MNFVRFTHLWKNSRLNIVLYLEDNNLLTEQFLDRLHDEDDADKSGKSLFCEPRKVSDDGGKVQGHDDQAEQGGPQTYPESHREVVDLEVVTEVDEDLLEDEDGSGTAEDSERLTSEQTEHSSGYEVTKEGLEDSLHTVKRSKLATANWSSPGVPP